MAFRNYHQKKQQEAEDEKRKQREERKTNLFSVLYSAESSQEQKRQAAAGLGGMGHQVSPALFMETSPSGALLKYAKAINAPSAMLDLIKADPGAVTYAQLRDRMKSVKGETQLQTVADVEVAFELDSALRGRYGGDAEKYLSMQKVVDEIGSEMEASLLGVSYRKQEKPSALDERLAAADDLVTNPDGTEKPWSKVDVPRNQVRADILSVDLAKAYGSDQEALADAKAGIIADIQGQMAFPQFDWPKYQKAFIEGKQGDIPDNTWKLMQETLDKRTALPDKDKAMKRSVDDVVDQIAAHTGRRRALQVPKKLRSSLLWMLNEGTNKGEALQDWQDRISRGEKPNMSKTEYLTLVELLDD